MIARIFLYFRIVKNDAWKPIAGAGFDTVIQSNIPLFAVVISLQYISFLVLCLYLTYRLLKHYCCVRTICKEETEISDTNVPAAPQE